MSTISSSATAGRTVRKSWNFSLNQTEALYSLLEDLLTPLGCSALVLPEGKALHVRPSGPADLVTLSQAASLCHQYLRLRDGDVAIMNDPFSGGTSLSDITLVAGACFETDGPEAELLLVRRLSLAPRLTAGNKLDDEGVRIPPTPLASGTQLNADLLAAIAAHPLSPAHLQTSVTRAIDEMRTTITEIKGIGRDPGSELKRANYKRYFADCSRAFETLMSRLPLGATGVTSQLASGETLKLQLEIGENRLHFDFAGTDNSPSIALTEMATFGACVAATAAALNHPIPLNAGSFEHVQVSTPAKTLLSGRAPSGMFRGMTDGIAAVCALVQAAFAKMNPTFKTADSAGCDGHFQVRFNDGRLLACRVAPGTGARKESAGFDAFAPWAPHLSHDLGVEELERTFPVSTTFAGLRSGSGGKGKNRGGDGVIQAITVNGPGVFRWSLSGMSLRQEGLESGRAGSAAEVAITRAKDGSTEEITAADGERELQAGDQIKILSAGGGGYGEPE